MPDPLLSDSICSARGKRVWVPTMNFPGIGLAVVFGFYNVVVPLFRFHVRILRAEPIGAQRDLVGLPQVFRGCSDKFSKHCGYTFQFHKCSGKCFLFGILQQPIWFSKSCYPACYWNAFTLKDYDDIHKKINTRENLIKNMMGSLEVYENHTVQAIYNYRFRSKKGSEGFFLFYFTVNLQIIHKNYVNLFSQ